MYSRNNVCRIQVNSLQTTPMIIKRLSFNSMFHHLPTFHIKNDFRVYLKQKIYKISAQNLKDFSNMLEK